MALRLDAVADVMAGSRMLQAASLRYARASWRLSSGSRIPTAAFDASGLTVGKKLQLQAMGWQRAQKNVQDGVSLGMTADGAMDELSHLVGRLRELAVYSATGTLTDADRSAIQDEVDAVRQNIAQVVDGTTFNGQLLLHGQEYRPAPEVDADGPPVPTPPPGAGYTGITLVGGVSPVSGTVHGTTDTEAGVYDVQVVTAPTAAEVAGAVPAATIPGAAGTAAIVMTVDAPGVGTFTVTFDHGDTPAAMVTKFNNAADAAATAAGFGSRTVDASLQTLYGPPDQYMVVSTTGEGGAYRVSVSAVPDPSDPTPVVPSDYIGFSVAGVSAQGTEMTATINGQMAQVHSSIGKVSFGLDHPGDDADGVTFVLTDPQVPGTFAAGTLLGNVNVTAFPVQILDLDMPIHSGPNSGDEQSLRIAPMTVGAISLDDTNTPDRIGTIDLSTQGGALAALDVLDAAAEQIGQARGKLGGDLNALQHALDLAAGGAEDQATAESRVMDSDTAQDAADLAQAQILQATASAALAHANLQVVAGLRLITDSRIQVPTGAPQPTQQRQSGAQAPASSGGSGAGGASVITGSGGGGGATIGGGTGTGAIGALSLPGSGGFSPMPVAGGAPFTPMPVIAGSGALGSTATLGMSADQMAGMISNALT